MTLSIIIPVYNGQAWLRRCVNSVAEELPAGARIILVDDGSTDETAKICDEIAENDARTTVIHQSNGGLSAARNAGLKRADTACVTFVDCDDTVERGTLRRVMAVMEARPDVDIVEYPWRRVAGEVGPVVWPDADLADADGSPTTAMMAKNTDETVDFDHNTAKNATRRAAEYDEANGLLILHPTDYWHRCAAYRHAYAWNKVYRRRLFDEVQFPEGRVFEDTHTLPRLLARCERVGVTHAGCYNYYTNPQGITQTAGARELNDLLEGALQLWGTPLGADRNARYYEAVLNVQIDVYERGQLAIRLPRYEGPGPRPPKVRLARLVGVKTVCRLSALFHKVRRAVRMGH